ncbi:hypothetical protein RIR_e18674_A0A2N0QNR7_9GLOM [Rhizophagus irregularis DAOM 181602=DAOM 197198]|nr:hypothetical protein RIR_e18674_A0A2N0QNR7_9GLOM [Rhizophagus irregularis DAOM 181602=DAOM 197198]
MTLILFIAHLFVFNKKVIDAGDILFDVLSKIFKIFLIYKNSLFGGEGFLFIGNYIKIVNEIVL